MIHLLSAVLCVAAVCAFASRRMKTHDGQVAELLRAGFKNIGVAEWQPFGVYWLRRLTGPRYWEWGDTLVGADLEHSDQIATLPGKATIKVLRIRTVKCDAMPSLETYAGLVAIDLMMVNYDYSDVQGDGDPELWPCLQVIAQCDTLQGLNLYETGVTDRGLKELARLPKIRYIDLSGNPGITDDGLVYLASTKSLEKLGLGGTDVTTKGVERLRAALPQCEIARDGKPK